MPPVVWRDNLFAGLALPTPGWRNGIRGGLKIHFEVLAAQRTKTQGSEIACICNVSPQSHNALPRNETHQIANPTDTTTDTSARVEAATDER
ncbi:MAG: hypothetical protein WBQ31_11885, partial [Candidatus Acidiferrales bacterium]